MIKYIVVNGFPGSGKTTFADKAVDELQKRQHASCQMSSVDLVKELAGNCGWDGNKDLKSRKFLSDLKHVLVTSPWGNLTMQAIIRRAEWFERAYCEYTNVYIFVMVREPEEIQQYVEQLGAMAVYVRNKHAENTPTSNDSDANVQNFSYHYYIDNNGDFNHLDDEVKKFITNLLYINE